MRLAGAIALILLAALGCPPPPPLDHFTVYKIQPSVANHPVALTDQFASESKTAQLSAIVRFGTPSRKIHDGQTYGIDNGHRHLLFYELAQEEPEPLRTVEFENQFGKHSVDIDQPRFLLVPATIPSDPIPDGYVIPPIDHFKCYEIVETHTLPPLPSVTIGGLLSADNGVPVGPPQLFCLPAKKERDGEPPVGISKPDDHLAVYEVPPKGVGEALSVEDQFGPHGFTVLHRMQLAVPSQKLSVAVAGD